MDSLPQDINARIAESGYDGADDAVVQAVHDCEEKLGKSFRNLLPLTFQSFEEEEATPEDDTSLNDNVTPAVAHAVVDAVKDGEATPIEEEVDTTPAMVHTVVDAVKDGEATEAGEIDSSDTGQYMCCFSAPWRDDSSLAPSLASSSDLMGSTESPAVVAFEYDTDLKSANAYDLSLMIDEAVIQVSI